MTEICLVCNCGVLSVLEQQKSINIMLQYVLGCQKKDDQTICEACYNELKIAFAFKRKFYQSRRLRLKELRSTRAAVELEHNYAQEEGNSPSSSHKPKTDAEDQLTKVCKTKGTKNAVRDQSASLNSQDTTKNKGNNDEPASTNKILEENEPTCSKNFSIAQIDIQDKKDNLKTTEAREENSTNVEYLENNETEEVYYIVEVLGPADGANLKDPLEESNDKENENQVEEPIKNRKVQSKEGARIKSKNKKNDLEYKYDNSGKLKTTQCVFCFRIFNSFDELVNHKKRHQVEENPYRCPSFGCKSRFKYWHSRQRHLIVHAETKQNNNAHNRSEKTSWLCSDCGRGFALKEIFDSHLKSHNRGQHFECKYCFKSFATETNLQKHVRTHTKASLFQCHDCGRGFISNNRLEIHKRIHSGIKPFQCEVCQAAFVSSSGLIKHWRVNSHFRGAIKPSPDLDLKNKK